MRKHPERDLNNFRLLNSPPGALCSDYEIIGNLDSFSSVRRGESLRECEAVGIGSALPCR